MKTFFCFLLLFGLATILVSGIFEYEHENRKEPCSLTPDANIPGGAHLIPVAQMDQPAFEVLFDFLETKENLNLNAVTCVLRRIDRSILYRVQYSGKLVDISMSLDDRLPQIKFVGYVPVPFMQQS